MCKYWASMWEHDILFPIISTDEWSLILRERLDPFTKILIFSSIARLIWSSLHLSFDHFSFMCNKTDVTLNHEAEGATCVDNESVLSSEFSAPMTASVRCYQNHGSGCATTSVGFKQKDKARGYESLASPFIRESHSTQRKDNNSNAWHRGGKQHMQSATQKITNPEANPDRFNWGKHEMKLESISE